ncbi:MAG: hypothetical protein JSV91_12150 [Phycisphaerales bacterium]|nr:MAG: hypothetical protein JSV91_12150 [Phycisphaerales bacterium]
MSKPSAKKSRQRRRKRSGPPQIKPVHPASDRTIYAGLILIGLFFVLLASLATGGHWELYTILYLALLAWFVNYYAALVYRGAHMANWKQAMARLPLRFVGYGTKGGKPLEAAHGHREVRNVLVLSIVISIAVIVGLWFLLDPNLEFLRQ